MPKKPKRKWRVIWMTADLKTTDLKTTEAGPFTSHADAHRAAADIPTRTIGNLAMTMVVPE